MLREIGKLFRLWWDMQGAALWDRFGPVLLGLCCARLFFWFFIL